MLPSPNFATGLMHYTFATRFLPLIGLRIVSIRPAFISIPLPSGSSTLRRYNISSYISSLFSILAICQSALLLACHAKKEKKLWEEYRFVITDQPLHRFHNMITMCPTVMWGVFESYVRMCNFFRSLGKWVFSNMCYMNRFLLTEQTARSLRDDCKAI